MNTLALIPVDRPAPGPRPAPSRRGFETPSDFAARLWPLLPTLVRHARALLASDDAAWDAVQETLLRLWLRGHLPEDPEPVLLHLVRRSSLHLLRCQRRRSDHEAHASAGPRGCCAEDPLRNLENEELRSSIESSVARLAVEFRVVFELYEFRGQSYEAIADELGIPIGTVRSRLNRARAHLREDLARFQDECAAVPG